MIVVVGARTTNELKSSKEPCMDGAPGCFPKRKRNQERKVAARHVTQEA